jgi:hypothetical protein
MKIGDFAKVSEIMNQYEHKWVVLHDLKFDDDYRQLIGGYVYHIDTTKLKASAKAEELYVKDIDAILIPGLPDEEVIIGGLFVT